MNRYLPIFLISFFIIQFGCKQSATENNSNTDNKVEEEKPEKRQFPISIERGKFFEKDGRNMLYGGEKDDMHFDITEYDLIDSQFHFGIGRERFPALLEPAFIDIATADTIHADTTRFLVARIGSHERAYSIEDLTRHEVVNDVIDGKPVMAAYCILADLGAMYDRNIGDRKFTFALSGYTYHDDTVWEGMDGFVLWDRETESLWWPLIGKAISGSMQGTKMQVLDESQWKQTTWADVKENYPNALVLKSGQDFDRPESWHKYTDMEAVDINGKSVAPRWGENGN